MSKKKNEITIPYYDDWTNGGTYPPKLIYIPMIEGVKNAKKIKEYL